MEGDEMEEMSREELQHWIRAEVEARPAVPAYLLEKCSVLQSLLQRREKRAAKLLKLCESVAECEALVKKQYTSLGWKYDDTESDEDCSGHDQMPSLSNDPKTQGHLPLADSRSIAAIQRLQYSKTQKTGGSIKRISSQIRMPVVSLTRIPESKINALPPPPLSDTPLEGDSSSDSGSDKQCEPHHDSRDSCFLVAKCNSRPKKRRKIIDRTKERVSPSPDTHQSAFKADAESNSAQITQPQQSAKATPGNQASTNPPSVLQEEVSVNMPVLARKTAMSWQRGKIVCIVRKDGQLKYKVLCQGKRKLLVSGHHIAFDRLANVDLLFIGARVAVDLTGDEQLFHPGIIAELPVRTNRMRFMVFADDHTPAYVPVAAIKLVCRPLKDPSEDIVNAAHRDFIKEYIKRWPHHPQLQYQVGQAFNVDFEGVQQMCEVEELDCSLMKVVFKGGEHKEWLHKGSMRLEVMNKLKAKVDLKNRKELKQRETSTS